MAELLQALRKPADVCVFEHPKQPTRVFYHLITMCALESLCPLRMQVFQVKISVK